LAKRINYLIAFFYALILYVASIRPVFSDVNFLYFILTALLINIISVIGILNFRLSQVKDKWDYFILPILHIIGVFFFISFFVSYLAKLFIIIMFCISMFIIHQSLSVCYKKNMALPIESRNWLTSLSMITIFLSSVFIFNFYAYWEVSVFALAFAHFIVIFGINHFLLKQMLVAPNLYSNLYNFIISLIIAQSAFILNYWSVNYPGYRLDKILPHLGVPVASLIILLLYYCIWGLVYYLIEGRLTKKVMYEYIFVGIIGFIFVIITTKWIPIF
jgi:hypothetical protein